MRMVGEYLGGFDRTGESKQEQEREESKVML